MQKKLFLVFITLILIGVLTTGFLTLSLFKVSYINSIKDKLISNGGLIEEFLLNTKDINELDLDNISKNYSKKINARITFISRNGTVLGDSNKELKDLDNHINRQEVQKALEGKLGTSQRYSNSLAREMYYVAIPFERTDSELAVVRLSVPLSSINEFNSSLFKNIFISIVAGFLVAFLLAFRYVGSFTKPIKELTFATKNIASGNYGERVYYTIDDELGTLADNFNIMSEKLEEIIGEIEDRNTKNKAILTSMINGIIALDNRKRIMFINPAAEEMFGFKEENIKGKYILEVVRNNILDEQIQKLLTDNIPTKSEIEIIEPKNKILNIYSNPIRLANNPNRKIGVVIIIQDVTEMRKLEIMRKDFVANVSHELKTPLTSIKGFIETLKNGAAEKKEVRDKFIDIIDIEAGRLTSLIQDLLVLSEIENKHNMINKEKIDVNKSINEVVAILNEIARKKNIKIIQKLDSNLPILFGNKTWFKQMLINLIDNAIKYTPNHGDVTIIGYSINKKIVIKVKDTGMGIDKKHLSRLFERFYRVDKARSRRVGGTGLGLAIVKHIIIAFNGQISVDSQINVGTEFTVSLPIED